MNLYCNHPVIELLGLKLRQKMKINQLKIIILPLVFSLILTHKFTEMHKIILNDVIYNIL
jgi:hypothetical protein